MADYDDARTTISPPTDLAALDPVPALRLPLAARGRERALASRGAEPFVRQLAWRDFYAQLLAARPETRARDLRPAATAGATTATRSRRGRRARPGYPIVDAGMRQLAREGFMHNRARLIAASFLTKDLHIDWRAGARALLRPARRRRRRQQRRQLAVGRRHGRRHAARTASSTRPSQARRFDPDGDYVRR